MIEPIEMSFTVPCSAAHAFEVWTGRISTWWPPSHSVSQDPGLAVILEPFAGGRIFERTPGGVEHDWGEVTGWDPPRGFSYRWHLRQDRDDATDVTIQFVDAAEGAEVRITHEDGNGSARAARTCGSETSVAGPGCCRPSKPPVRLDPTVTERLR